MSVIVNQSIEQIRVPFNETYVALYLLKGEKNVLIDTGIPLSPERDILPTLKSLGLSLSDINVILNTHGHPDHTGGNSAVKAASDAQICIHKEDAPFLYDQDQAFRLYFAPLFEAMGISVSKAKENFLQMAGPPVAPDRELQDGDVIDGGSEVKLRVIHLPGHSFGSIGIFWEEEGILFSGDSISGLHNEGGGLPIILDILAYKQSLKRLKEIPIRFLLCSHPYRGIHLSPSFVRQGEEVSKFLQNSLEFAERVDEAILKVSSYQHEMNFPQLADEVIAQLPEEMGFKPMRQVARPFFSGQVIYFRLHPIHRANQGGSL